MEETSWRPYERRDEYVSEEPDFWSTNFKKEVQNEALALYAECLGLKDSDCTTLGCIL